MEILLLDIAGLALERRVTLVAVDEHITRHNTHRNTGRENVEESGLSGTRSAHECSESTRLDPSVDVVQQAAGFALDLDVVANILPVENRRLPLNLGHSGVDVIAIVLLDVFSLALLVFLDLGSLGDVLATEQKHLALGLGGGNELGRQKVDTAEEDNKAKENAEVPVCPLVGDARIEQTTHLQRCVRVYW